MDKEADVFGDRVALFILHKIAEMGDTTLSVLNDNLVAPHGWIAFAKVWRADFVDVIGDYVTITEAGKRAAADISTFYAVVPRLGKP
jgi:hypothetical protein